MKPLHIDPFYRFLRTHRDASDMVANLTSVHSHLFDESLSPEKLLLKEVPYELAEIIQKIAIEGGVDLNDKMAVDTFLQELEEAISHIPVMTINLARSPKQELLDTVTNWWVTNFKTHILLDIRVDPTIIAGMQIYFNGKYKDYSLRRQLEKK